MPIATASTSSINKKLETSAPVDSSGPKDGLRETIESIVIAFVLAFLFRTFEAEAFVIPTGSMAPTLMGRHYDTTCPKCKIPLKIGGSEDVDDAAHDQGRRLQQHVCPNCRYVAEYPRDAPPGLWPYNGDRIIVSKFPYEVGDPQRWDVAVFRYPATPKTNYIKRITGLPNETVMIRSGDIFTLPANSAQADDFHIQRKPPHKVLAMLQTVHDNDFIPEEMRKNGWPSRWQGAEGEGAAWKVSSDGKSYQIDGQQPAATWLRYQHLVPNSDEWEQLLAGPLSEKTRQSIRPQLISDMYAYNSREMFSRYDEDRMGLHWVGDLAVECQLKVEQPQGKVTLELIEAGHGHRCQFDLATGEATLTIDSAPEFRAKAKTKVRGPCTVNLRFANIDDQLLLWVNDSLIEFDGPATFASTPNEQPTIEDWSPVGIAVEGTSATVDHLRILRDIYYIADQYVENAGRLGIVSDYRGLPDLDRDYTPLSMYLQLDSTGKPAPLPKSAPVKFRLGPDEFLALGDNSPKSKDSRLWDSKVRDPKTGAERLEYFVSRDLLVGKAMFIYWPHAWAPDWAYPIATRRLGGNMTFRVPFYPNFGRMQFIR